MVGWLPVGSAAEGIVLISSVTDSSEEATTEKATRRGSPALHALLRRVIRKAQIERRE
jgi:hypothetical protein